METCGICCEDSKKIICCKYCENKSCSNCIKHYLEDTTSDPHCMFCRKGWTKDYLYSILPKTYINTTLRKARENTLFDRERAMMPATQQRVEQFLNRREQNRKISSLTNEIKEERTKIYAINSEFTERIMKYKTKTLDRILSDNNSYIYRYIHRCPNTACNGQINEEHKCNVCNVIVCTKCNVDINNDSELNSLLHTVTNNVKRKCNVSKCNGMLNGNKCCVCHAKQCTTCVKLCADRRTHVLKVRELTKSRNDIYRNIQTGSNNQGTSTVVKCNRKCPKEDCKGFLNNDTYSCGICKSNVCKKCNEIIEDENTHTCTPENIATTELLNKDTKPCPQCGTLIHKITGCDQMWCTSCNTPFSWRRGTIETGHIHNPHYFEWMVRTNQLAAPRNVHDHVCGGLPPNYLIVAFDKTNSINVILTSVYRFILHIQYVELYRWDVGNQDNTDLRILYMINELSEDDFKTKLQRREKSRYKKQEYLLIFRMLHDTLSEYFRQINEILHTFPLETIRGFNRHMVITDDDSEKISQINEIAQTFSQLREFANTQFLKTAKYLNNQPLRISSDWELV